MAAVLAIPAVAAGMLGHGAAAAGLLLGALLLGPVRRSVGGRGTALLAASAAAGVFVAVALGDHPVAPALVIAASCLLVAAAGLRGNHQAAVMMPVTIAILATGGAPAAQAGGLALAVLAGALYGALAIALIPIPPAEPVPPLSRERARIYGAVLAVLAGAAQFVVSEERLPHGYWLTMTVLFVVMPSGPRDTFGRAVQRVAGTVAGAVVAVAVGVLVPAPGLLAGLGVVLILVSMAEADARYSVRSALVTVGAVLVAGALVGTEEAAALRLLLTAAGAVVVMAVAAGASLAISRLSPTPAAR